MHCNRRKVPRVRITLPAVPRSYPWDVLTAVLADCQPWLSSSDTDHVSKIIRSRDAIKVMELGNTWGLQCTTPGSNDFDLTTCRIKLLLGSLVKKFQFDGRASERRQVAINSLLDAETSCSWFNTKGWKALMVDGKPSVFLQSMREFIERTIDYFPPEWDDLTLASRHGPGADIGSLCGKVTAYYKWSSWPYSTTDYAFRFANRLISNDQRWYGALEDSVRRKSSIPFWAILDQQSLWDCTLKRVPGNRITTVPKDGRKDRPIAIEPRMNLMLQLGVDGFIRKRLKRWDIDLDNGWLKNQKLARLGSVDNSADSPCTLDLSNASDSVSLRLIRLLFPRPWFTYLCSIRSPSGVLPDGRRLRYSKLSSMGNGYTFAVESLVFASILYAAQMHVYGRWQRDLTAVFGDDLVTPHATVGLVSELLRLCGFSLNQSKSFSSPGVRESCGTDWIQGQLVRPVHLDRYPRDLRDILSIRNRLFRWRCLYLDGRAESAVDAYLGRYLPSNIATLYGPLSDTEFDSTWHCPSKGKHLGNDVYTFSAIKCVPIHYRTRELLFQKLMHSLRGRTQLRPENPWDASPKGGSVFTITQRGRERLTVGTRHCLYWQDEYCLPQL